MNIFDSLYFRGHPSTPIQQEETIVERQQNPPCKREVL